MSGERRAHVVGLGLIGTSCAAALRQRGWRVSGEDLDESRQLRALELGHLDAIGPETDAELAIVATPVAAIAEVVNELFAASTNAALVVTDVGGVKAPVVAAVTNPRFIGGHPMAGSEQIGPDGADPELFEGATWVLTPNASTDPEVFSALRRLVASFGAEVVALEAERHDALVAVISHLPHLVAANLMVLADQASESHAALLRLAAGGFRDMTRIAAGDPAIWPDIFRDNADAVIAVLDDLIGRLEVARGIVERRDRTTLVELLSRAQAARRNLPARVSRPETLMELRVPVADRPGVLAEVTTVLGEHAVNIFDLEIAHSAEGRSGVLVVTIDGEEHERARAALVERGYRPAVVSPGAR